MTNQFHELLEGLKFCLIDANDNASLYHNPASQTVTYDRWMVVSGGVSYVYDCEVAAQKKFETFRNGQINR